MHNIYRRLIYLILIILLPLFSFNFASAYYISYGSDVSESAAHDHRLTFDWDTSLNSWHFEDGPGNGVHAAPEFQILPELGEQSNRRVSISIPYIIDAGIFGYISDNVYATKQRAIEMEFIARFGPVDTRQIVTFIDDWDTDIKYDVVSSFNFIADVGKQYSAYAETFFDYIDVGGLSVVDPTKKDSHASVLIYAFQYFGFDEIEITPVPEPFTMLLLGTGLLGLAGWGRKKFKKN